MWDIGGGFVGQLLTQTPYRTDTSSRRVHQVECDVTSRDLTGSIHISIHGFDQIYLYMYTAVY